MRKASTTTVTRRQGDSLAGATRRFEGGPPAPAGLPERTAVLLDLSGDKEAALEWSARHLRDYTVQPINKADLKWKSRREALAEARSAAPDLFVIFTSDIKTQAARGAMIVFAALSGARRIIFADPNGHTVSRSRAGAFFIEGPRLAIELAFGYAVIVPLSWALTAMLSATLGFRKVARAPRDEARGPDGGGKKLTALYVRATIVPASASTGGMASHVSGFTGGALALGHGLKFISTSRVGIDESKVEMMLLETSSAMSATRALFELWNNLVFTARALACVKTWLDPRGADFIYQRYSRFNWTGVALSLVTGLPLALEYNGSEVWLSRHWDPVGQLGLLKRFERLSQRAADLIFVVSDVDRRNLIGAGVDPAKVVVNVNGVDAEEFRPGCGGAEVRRDLGLDQEVVVGFVGTFGPWHGATVLAEAAGRIERAVRPHFLFIGDGDQRAAAEAIIEAAGVGATFAGRVAHRRVAAYLDACDILASPHVQSSDGSEFFGSPTKLFEYMAMAKPVVASRLGQIADVITDGETGLLVPPGDADALARAIERLANDEVMRSKLGAEARRAVVENFTWRHNAARVFELLSLTKVA